MEQSTSWEFTYTSDVVQAIIYKKLLCLFFANSSENSFEILPTESFTALIRDITDKSAEFVLLSYHSVYTC